MAKAKRSADHTKPPPKQTARKRSKVKPTTAELFSAVCEALYATLLEAGSRGMTDQEAYALLADYGCTEHNYLVIKEKLTETGAIQEAEGRLTARHV